MTIQHQSGDEIDTANLRLGGDVSFSSSDLEGPLNETFSAGDQFTISANNTGSTADLNIASGAVTEDTEIQIIYQSGDGSGSILRTFEVPRDHDNS